MRLIFHGELRALYGPFFEIQASSVRDAIDGFSRQQENWPKDLMVQVPGFDREEDFEETADEIHMMPALIGGGGNFGKIIIGAVLIVGALFIPIPGLQQVLMAAGVSLVLQGVMGIFFKSPTASKNNDPDASKYLGINKNTTAVGTPIIMAWGRIDIAPHWLSLQSDSSNLTQGVFPANPT
ncbi:MAG: hypothetical protein ACTHJR_16540 [Sphingomonas sp.]|uniref:hypothetical protein n=1 Tax=Sphingomonas sp. TaxID=28214 RepID=UPI003F7F7769